MNAPGPLAAIPINSRQELRATLIRHLDRDWVELRVWSKVTRTQGAEWVPIGLPINIPVTAVDQLVTALEAACIAASPAAG